MGSSGGVQVAASDYPFLEVGEESISRFLAPSAITLTSGLLRLTYRRASRSELITQFRIITNTTPAGATPTLVRMGLWTVAANGDLALVASTPNDTALLAGATTTYSKAATSPYQKVAGQWYAFGVLVVTGATAPTVYGASSLTAAEKGFAPQLAAAVAGQTDLPASLPVASATSTAVSIYMVASP